jgi:hypothetical protein
MSFNFCIGVLLFCPVPVRVDLRACTYKCMSTQAFARTCAPTCMCAKSSGGKIHTESLRWKECRQERGDLEKDEEFAYVLGLTRRRAVFGINIEPFFSRLSLKNRLSNGGGSCTCKWNPYTRTQHRHRNSNVELCRCFKSMSRTNNIHTTEVFCPSHICRSSTFVPLDASPSRARSTCLHEKCTNP